MKKLFISSGLILSGLAFVSAQVNISIGAPSNAVGGNILNLILASQSIVGQIGKLLMALAVVAFFWYLVQFIWKGSEDADKKHKSLIGMGYSILALFVMFSVFGIISWMGSSVGVGQGGSMVTPCIPGTNSGC